ncbi:Regulator of Vps4 activity in the MVB pathway protein [Citrus sinensis]|nr:Regulator of Vps4 activity in the MVB pathway protein [Citrus sinensis]
MLDSFFNKGFKGSKCKTLLKLAIPRIKLLRNRREIQIKQMRRDIAKLLETGQEATARIRVEHIVREENMMAAQEILELYCELIVVRLPIIETQRECPLDLKEAISSVCFAAPRCADLPELLQVQMLFASKYGREFVAAATELMPDCGVNRQLIELLSVRAPSADKKLKLLKEIAEEHELDWDPAATETEYFKPQEDLLNGPTQFVSASKLPLPKEKHDETLNSAPDQAQNKNTDSDVTIEMLAFPEVPTAALKPGINSDSATATSPRMPAASHPAVQELSQHAETTENLPHLEPEELMQGKSAANKDEIPDESVGDEEDRQFVPFISPPSLTASFSGRQSSLPPTISKTQSETNVDLQDVLAAAQAAAETAERAAAAARSAASLAQMRISGLTQKKNDAVSENPFYTDGSDQSCTSENQHFDHKTSLNDPGTISNSLAFHQVHEQQRASELPDLPSFDHKVVFDSSPNDRVSDQEPVRHQPQRLTSMDDDSHFSYPNLFSSQNPNLGSGSDLFTDNSRANH